MSNINIQARALLEQGRSSFLNQPTTFNVLSFGRVGKLLRQLQFSRHSWCDSLVDLVATINTTAVECMHFVSPYSLVMPILSRYC